MTTHEHGESQEVLWAAERDRESAYEDWSMNVILGSDVEAVAHEAFCAGWEALHALLGSDHYVIFTEDRWTIEHSVECRLSGHMHECAYHAAIAGAATEYDPGMAGRWRITAISSYGIPPLLEPAP